MHIRPYVLALFMFATVATAQTQFPLGTGMEKWGIPLKVPESEVTLRLGARYQTLATFLKEEDLDSNTESTSQDFQSRRVRFQLQAELPKGIYYSMDVRNDGANRGDQGDGNFEVGDAFVHFPVGEGNLS